MRSDYKLIAHIEKAHGKRGEVVAVPVHGLPPLLHEGMEVAVVPPHLKGNRPHVVERVSDNGSRPGQLVSLSGVGSLKDSESLRGRYVLAKRGDLPEDVELRDAERMVGRLVVDERLGELGRVTEVIQTPANDVWALATPEGELLLPAIADIHASLTDAGTVCVCVPPEMLQSLMQNGEGEDS